MNQTIDDELSPKLRRYKASIWSTMLLQVVFKRLMLWMEFEEVREYVPGDDIRNIDWNVTQEAKNFI